MSEREITIQKAELEELIEKAVNKAFDNAGLLMTEPKDRLETIADIKFLRRIRQAFDGTASMIGKTILIALVGSVLTLLGWAIKAKFGN